MMTVFFYSGITSYPGVSTEEKTIWFSSKILKRNVRQATFTKILPHFSVGSRGLGEYRIRLGFAVPKCLVPDLVLIYTKSQFRFWIWFCQESKLSFGFGFGFVKNQN